MGETGKTLEDQVKCGCDEYPECVHVLYWYEELKAACEVRDTESANLKKRLAGRVKQWRKLDEELHMQIPMLVHMPDQHCCHGPCADELAAALGEGEGHEWSV